MSQPCFSLRLLPSVPTEIEWKYLVNETYIGERTIVPLLQEVLKDSRVVGPLRGQIQRQLEEEVEHVRLYFRVIGNERLIGSGYDVPFSKYVRNLPNVSLKLFALQGMLEGMALGALNYRLQYLEQSPSKVVDTRARREEEGHVRCSFPFFSHLIGEEGVVTRVEFRRVTKDVNEIFVSHFSGETLARFVNQNWGKSLAAAPVINASQALKEFRKQSSFTVVKNKTSFLEKYFQSVPNDSD